MYTKFSGLVPVFEILYVVTWTEKELVSNFTFLNFDSGYPFVSVVKLD